MVGGCAVAAFDTSLQQYSSILTPEQQQALLMATQATGGDIALAAQQLMTQSGLFPQTQDLYQQVRDPTAANYFIFSPVEAYYTTLLWSGANYYAQ